MQVQSSPVHRKLTDVNTALPYSNSTRRIILITMNPADDSAAVNTVALETPFVFYSQDCFLSIALTRHDFYAFPRISFGLICEDSPSLRAKTP